MKDAPKPSNRPTLTRGTRPQGKPSVTSGRTAGNRIGKKGGCRSCK